MAAPDLDAVYSRFRQEKGIDERTLPPEGPLAVELAEEDVELPLVITKLSDVTGVNAIVSGSSIEPHAGITILFGENGTGKTGYSRIFKALEEDPEGPGWRALPRQVAFPNGATLWSGRWDGSGWRPDDAR